MKFTTITSADIIGKTYDSNGEKGMNVSIVRGVYRSDTVASLAQFAQHLDALDAGKYMLIFGTVTDGATSGQIGLVDGDQSKRRTNANFPFASAPGILCIDNDQTPLSPDQTRAMLSEIHPMLASAGLVWMPSASSYIWNGGTQISDLKGAHTYLSIADASDIGRAGQVLFDRLYLAGYGRAIVGENGRVHLRTPFDAAMLKPSQPDFAGGALCTPPMRQMRGKAVHLAGMERIDTRAFFPDVTGEERARLVAMQEADKLAAQPEAAAKAETHLAGRIGELRAELSPEEAEKRIAQLRSTMTGENVTLPLDYPVKLKGGDTVLVSDILNDRKKYQHVVCYDPLNPSYVSGRINTDGNRPNILCHASNEAVVFLGHIGESMMPPLAQVQQTPVQPINAPISGPNVTQDGLALELGQQYFDQNGRFLTNSGKWLFWNGSFWEVDDVKRSWTLTRAFLRNKAQRMIDWVQTHQFTNEKEREQATKAVQKQVKELRSAPMVAAVHGLMASNPDSAVTVDMLNKDIMKIGTPNGTVDLRTGVWMVSDPNDLITRTVAVTPAKEGTPTPIWDKFLMDVTGGDSELIGFLQRLFGYALTGSTIEQKFAFFYGTGRNGKGVFLNTMMGILGDYSRKAAANAFIESRNPPHTSNIAGLHDARFVLGAEIPANAFWNESLLKDITGGDTISVQFMRQDYFDLIPQFFLAIAGNTKPAIRQVDPAIRDRLLLVPFEKYIAPKDRDLHLPEKLKAEWPAIFRWAIDGCLKWQEIGLAVPASIMDASEEYFNSEDFLGQFIEEFCIIDPMDKECAVEAREFCMRYNNWRTAQGLNSVARVTVTQDISKFLISYRKRRVNGTKTSQFCYDGVKLKKLEFSTPYPMGVPNVPNPIL